MLYYVYVHVFCSKVCGMIGRLGFFPNVFIVNIKIQSKPLISEARREKKKNIKEGSVDHDLSNYFDFWS